MSRYFVHPVEENFQEWDREYKRKRNAYWRCIQRAHKDYEDNEHHGHYEANLNSFRYWMERKWGVGITIVDGHIGADFSIINQKKFMLFELKYATDTIRKD